MCIDTTVRYVELIDFYEHVNIEIKIAEQHEICLIFKI